MEPLPSRHLLFTACLALLSTSVGRAANVTWTGGTGTWTTASDWSGGSVPVAGDDVIVDDDMLTTSSVSLNTNTATLGSFLLASGDTLQNSGNSTHIISTSGTFANYGTIRANVDNQELRVNLTPASSIVVNAGLLQSGANRLLALQGASAAGSLVVNNSGGLIDTGAGTIVFRGGSGGSSIATGWIVNGGSATTTTGGNLILSTGVASGTHVGLQGVTMTNSGSLLAAQGNALTGTRKLVLSGSGDFFNTGGLIQASEVELQAGLLRGFGTIAGNLTIAGGTLQPYLAGPDGLTVTGSASIANAVFSVDLDSVDSGCPLGIAGTFLIGENGTLMLAGGSAGASYTIATFNNTASPGLFGSVSSGFEVFYFDDHIVVSVIPEPASLPLAAGLLVLLRLTLGRRRSRTS